MNKQALADIGLSPNESKVYLALLEIGSSGAGTISDKAGIHRRATYDALSRLTEKGIVSYVIEKKARYYEATSPIKLKEILNERAEQIKTQLKDIEKILPELLLKYKSTKSELIASIMKGKDGLKTVMELILQENKDWLSIGSSGKGPIIIPYFLAEWHKRRIKQKMVFKSILENNSYGQKRAKQLQKIGLSEIRFLPQEIRQPQTIWIFGNKVAIILISIEQPIIFVIESKEISDSFRGYFSWIWKNSREQ